METVHNSQHQSVGARAGSYQEIDWAIGWFDCIVQRQRSNERQLPSGSLGDRITGCWFEVFEVTSMPMPLIQDIFPSRRRSCAALLAVYFIPLACGTIGGWGAFWHRRQNASKQSTVKVNNEPRTIRGLHLNTGREEFNRALFHLELLYRRFKWVILSIFSFETSVPV